MRAFEDIQGDLASDKIGNGAHVYPVQFAHSINYAFSLCMQLPQPPHEVEAFGEHDQRRDHHHYSAPVRHQRQPGNVAYTCVVGQSLQVLDGEIDEQSEEREDQQRHNEDHFNPQPRTILIEQAGAAGRTCHTHEEQREEPGAQLKHWHALQRRVDHLHRAHGQEVMQPGKAQQNCHQGQEHEDQQGQHSKGLLEEQHAAEERPALQVLSEVFDHLVPFVLQSLAPCLQAILSRCWMQGVHLVAVQKSVDNGAELRQLLKCTRHRTRRSGEKGLCAEDLLSLDL